MRAKAKIMSDMVFFYIPRAFDDMYSPGDVVAVVVNDKLVAGKVITRGRAKFVVVSKKFASVIREGEEYEIKKVGLDV